MGQSAGDQVRVLTATVSDNRKRHSDAAGKRLDAELTAAGYRVVRHVILLEDVGVIRELVRGTAADNDADAIILVGGTGINPRDCTFEALDALFEKKIVGFGEAFRRLAHDALGPRAMYFRVSAGVFDQCPVFSLPGHVDAVALALKHLVLPTLTQAVAMATGRETATVGAAADRRAVAPQHGVGATTKSGAGDKT
jgi:molybdenum cofactor biosynthesis protein B